MAISCGITHGIAPGCDIARQEEAEMAKHPALTETAISKAIKTAKATQSHARLPGG